MNDTRLIDEILAAARHLIRHDYCAMVIGRWATAANYCRAAVEVAGLRVYVRRQVLPRLGEHLALPWPTLVSLDLHELDIALAPPGARSAAASEPRAATT